MYHRSGQTTASIAGEMYKTNVDITSHSLLNNEQIQSPYHRNITKTPKSSTTKI